MSESEASQGPEPVAAPDHAASPVWDRIAGLTPRLRDDVRVSRHRYRGRRWFVLQDALRGQWQRLDRRAYCVVALLDGERSVHDVRTLLANDPTQPTPSQDDIARILNTLAASELIDWGVTLDAEALEERHSRARRAQRLARFRSPLSLRFRLGDPDHLLDQNRALARFVFGPWGAALGLLTLLAGGVAALLHWHDIVDYWSVRGFTAQSLLPLAGVYLLVKTVHELAHGLATKRWGGEVHEAGIMLLLLMPVPYVDASAAWSFPQKWRRVVVGAAGILAELWLTAIAAIVFALVEVGSLKDVAYAAMLVGGVSTLAFNGNPLLRFDGYYVLADLIEIPNLSQRANQYWGYLLKRYLFGMTHASSPVTARGERKWFIGYGAAASVYRVGIALTIALLVASELPVLGFALAAWALNGQLVWPIGKQIVALFNAPGYTGHRARALTASASVVVAVLAALTLLPVPHSTHAEGVVWLPERANVRSGAEGIVARLLVAPDARVEAGEPILTIDNDLLQTHIDNLEWDLRALRAERAAARIRDRVKAQVIEDNIGRIQADLVDARAQADARVVVAPVSGTLVIPRARHLPGRFVRKGDVVAYVLEDVTPVVRVAVAQDDVGALRRHIDRAEVRLSERPQDVLIGQVLRETPSATERLPSKALGARGGGVLAVDASDSAGLRAAEPLFVVDVALPEQTPAERVGGRAHVRFRHGAEPIGHRLYRGLRRLLLSRLAV